jgi:hypothetical protein
MEMKASEAAKLHLHDATPCTSNQMRRKIPANMATDIDR